MVRAGNMQIPENKETQGSMRIDNLVKTYGKMNAINGLSLTVFKDEILVLLGHNGAGKTTTLNILTGLIEATSGTVKVDNLDISDCDLIGLCPQENILFEKMSIKENLEFYARFKNVQNVDQTVQEMLVKFNLDARQSVKPSEVSGGQKRKL